MVGFSCSTGKYQASLKIMDKLIFLGEFSSYKEAETAEKQLATATSLFISQHTPSAHRIRK